MLQQTRLENFSNSWTDRVFKSLSALFDFDFSDLWIFPDLLKRDDAGRFFFFVIFGFPMSKRFSTICFKHAGNPIFQLFEF